MPLPLAGLEEREPEEVPKFNRPKHIYVNHNPSDQSDRRHPDSSNPRAFSIGCGDSKRPISRQADRVAGESLVSIGTESTSQLGCLPLHMLVLFVLGWYRIIERDHVLSHLRPIFRHGGNKTCDPAGL